MRTNGSSVCCQLFTRAIALILFIFAFPFVFHSALYGGEQYTSLGAPVQEWSPLFEKTFNERNQVVRMTNREGGIVEYEYNDSGKLTLARMKLNEQEWAERKYYYDENNRIVKVLGPSGEETRYHRDERGLSKYVLFKVSSGKWSAVHLKYDSAHNIIFLSNYYFVSDPEHPEVDRTGQGTRYGYDANRNKLFEISPLGRITSFEYDKNNKPIAKIDPLGNRTLYEYDENGKLIKETDCLGGVTEWKYDLAGNVTEVSGSASGKGCGSCDSPAAIHGFFEWENGTLVAQGKSRDRMARIVYDVKTGMRRETDAAGLVSTSWYDEHGLLRRIENNDDLVVHFEYDQAGNPSRFRQGENSGFDYQYDLGGRLLSITSPDGGVIEYSYDKSGRVLSERIKIDDSTWSEKEIEYDLRGFLVKTTTGNGTADAIITQYTRNAAGLAIVKCSDPEGLDIVEKYDFDEDGQLICYVDPNASLTRLSYNDNGKLVGKISPEGRQVAYEYDALGRRTAEVYGSESAAFVKEYSYDHFGRLESIASGASRTDFEYNAHGERSSLKHVGRARIEYSYDGAGRPIEVKQLSDSGAFAVWQKGEYDANGRLRKVLDSAGSIVEYGYDGYGRLISVTNQGDTVTRYAYDALGRLVRVTFPDSSELKYKYDLAGRLIRKEGGVDGSVSFTYDTLGRRIGVTNANGHTQRMRYDAVGRLVEQINPLNESVIYEYDKKGNLISLTDGNKNVNRFVYDRDGKLIAVDFPGEAPKSSNAMRLRYDDMGRLICKITANNEQLRYAYDSEGQLTAVYHGQAVDNPAEIPEERLIAKYEYEYGDNHMAVRESMPHASFLYTYNEFGQLVESRDNVLNKAVLYSYNSRGLRDQMKMVDTGTGPENRVVAQFFYKYDSMGRPTSIGEAPDSEVLFEYDILGRRTKTVLPNGVSTTYSYGKTGLLADVSTSHGDTVLERYSYHYDVPGNRMAVTYLDGSQSTYSFDKANRLIRETRLDDASEMQYDVTYAYDAAGNRRSLTRTGWNPASIEYTYNSLNQLVSTTEGGRYSYDDNGNLVSITDKDATHSFQYDILNRLIGYSGGELEEKYTLIGQTWKRWRTDSNGQSVYSVYDKDDVLAEYVKHSETPAKLYVRQFIDDNLSVTMDDGSYYYSHDGLRNVTLLTDSGGHVVNRYSFTAMGESYLPETQETVTQRYGYKNRERERSQHFSFFRNRIYDHGSGRFISRDPLEFSVNRRGNLYEFVKNNPVVYQDIYGLQEQLLQTATQEQIDQAIANARAVNWQDASIMCTELKDGTDCAPIDPNAIARFLNGFIAENDRCNVPNHDRYELNCNSSPNCVATGYLARLRRDPNVPPAGLPAQIDICTSQIGPQWRDEANAITQTNANGQMGEKLLFEQSIAHELVHHMQEVCYGMNLGVNDPGFCRQQICKEMQAYRVSEDYIPTAAQTSNVRDAVVQTRVMESLMGNAVCRQTSFESFIDIYKSLNEAGCGNRIGPVNFAGIGDVVLIPEGQAGITVSDPDRRNYFMQQALNSGPKVPMQPPPLPELMP